MRGRIGGLALRDRTTPALGVVMILSWGSTYYLLAILAAPIRAETGWPAGLVTAGASVGLLVSGLAAPRIGTLIQREGGRRVMAGGMALIAAGLCGLAASPSIWAYLAAWLVIGLGMGAGLYDAAFGTLGRMHGLAARRAITALTLWGGFASTICWPLTAALDAWIGWRGTCLAYAGLLVAVALPLCLLAIPEGRTSSTVPRPVASVPTRFGGDPRVWCLGVAATALALLGTIWAVHLVAILGAAGYGLGAAVGLGMLIGPAQVGARVVEMVSGGRHHPRWTALAAAGLVVAGVGGLLAGLPAAAALVAYGAGNGLWSIARGALPLALFGPEEYARLMGRLAAPALIASAAAPMVGAWLIAACGGQGTMAILAALSLVPLVALVLLHLRYGRAGTGPQAA